MRSSGSVVCSFSTSQGLFLGEADECRKGRYLTSNVNITVEDEEGRAISVPIGERYAKFTTKQ